MNITISDITFSDGSQIKLPADGLVVLVGPNNVGKSRALRDIKGFLETDGYVGTVLTQVTFDRSQEDIVTWADEHVPVTFQDGPKKFRLPNGHLLSPEYLKMYWRSAGIGPLIDLFLTLLNAETRLTTGDRRQNISYGDETPTHPIHHAFENSQIEAFVSNESKATFGLGAVVDRLGGSTVELRIGDIPEYRHDNGAPDPAYISALKELPPLQEQGDGVRSYLGLLLHLATSNEQILLIDEPEAFLHPPQARRLGQVLAERAETQQVLLATHSSDILIGALSANAPITIIRITRDENGNHPAELNAAAVKEFWSDPLLRYSNLLDGLFHDGVVLCEGDGDCRFYGAVLDAISSDSGLSGDREPQILFSHCGGKSRMHSVVGSLSSVGIPVAAICDIDILSDRTDVEKLLKALTSDLIEPTEYESKLNVLSSGVQDLGEQVRRSDLRTTINEALDGVSTELVSSSELKKLQKMCRKESGWVSLKRTGLGGLPGGDVSAAGKELVELFKSKGLFVVPVGELERFAPEIPGHGPAWVSAALDAEQHLPGKTPATSFIRELRNWIATAT